MNQPALSRKIPALLTALFCCLLWGSAFPTIKAGLSYLSPLLFAGVRFLLAGAALLVLARHRHGSLASLRKNWPSILSIAFFQTIVGYSLFFQGMKSSSASTGSIIVSSGPIMVAIMAYPFLGEGDWSLPQAAGIAFGFTGVVLALFQPGWKPDFSLGGEGLILLSTISLAYSSIIAKKISGRVEPLFMAGGSMSIGGAVLLVVAAMVEPLSRQTIVIPSVILLLYAAFISAVTFTLWYALLEHNPVSTISTVKFTIPIAGSVLSALFLGDVLTFFKAAGGVMVGLGIYLIFFRRKKASPAVTVAP